MMLTLQLLSLALVSFGLYRLFIARKNLVEFGSNHKVFTTGFVFFSLLYWVLSTHYLQEGYRPILNNFLFGLPLFDLHWESMVSSGEYRWWSPGKVGGEPAASILGLLPQFHIPQWIVLSQAGFLQSTLDSAQAYFISLLLGNYFFSLGILFLFREIFKEDPVPVFAFAIGLFSGFSIGSLALEQYNALLAYVPWIFWSLSRFLKSKNPNWFLFSVTLFAISLTSHLPRLVLCLYVMISLSIFITNQKTVRSFLQSLQSLRLSSFLSALFIFGAVLLPSIIIQNKVPSTAEVIFQNGPLTHLPNFSKLAIDTKVPKLKNIPPLASYFVPQFMTRFGQGETRLNNLFFYLGILPILFAGMGVTTGNKSIRRFLAAVSVLAFLVFAVGFPVLFPGLSGSALKGLALHWGACCLNMILLFLSAVGLQALFAANGKKESSQPQFKEPQAAQGLTISGIKGISLFIPKFYLILIPALSLFIHLGFYILSNKLFTFRFYEMRTFLDEIIIILLSLVAFAWLIKNRGDRIWVVFLFLILTIDLGRFYMFSRNSLKVPYEKALHVETKSIGSEWVLAKGQGGNTNSRRAILPENL